MRRKTPAERIKTERLLTVLSAAFACLGAAFTAVTVLLRGCLYGGETA